MVRQRIESDEDASAEDEPVGDHRRDTGVDYVGVEWNRRTLAFATADPELWSRVRGGDQAAFAVLYCRHRYRVEKQIRSVLAAAGISDDERAAEITADVFLVVWRRRAVLNATTTLWPWLRAVANHLCANELRRRIREQRLMDRVGAAGGQVYDSASYATLLVDLAAALDRLGPTERLAAELCVVQDMRAADAAELLAIPVGTVKSRLNRARAALRVHLQAWAPAGSRVESGSVATAWPGEDLDAPQHATGRPCASASAG